MSENWVKNNVFCPCCGNPHLSGMKNNAPVADFQCDNCGEIFELKSKLGNLGRKINDGAYSTMLDRITSATNPELLVLNYSQHYHVHNLMLIPKFFFVPSIIEKRKPLSEGAHRAGWIGCNILLGDIPPQGRIDIIINQQVMDISSVVEQYQQIRKLQTNNLENRGWLFDVLNCINNIPTEVFSIKDIYKFAEILGERHPNNHNIEAKIRQQLQVLRDKDILEFIDRGQYRKNPRMFCSQK